MSMSLSLFESNILIITDTPITIAKLMAIVVIE